MILGPHRLAESPGNVRWHRATVARGDSAEPAAPPCGSTGLSGLGQVHGGGGRRAARWSRPGRPRYVLDGDNLRHGLNADLGLLRRGPGRERPPGRPRRLRCWPTPGWWRSSRWSSPYRADRDLVRALHGEAGLPFVEVFVDTPIELCEQRDPEGPLQEGPGRRAEGLHRHRRPPTRRRRRPELRAAPRRRRSQPPWRRAAPQACPRPDVPQTAQMSPATRWRGSVLTCRLPSSSAAGSRARTELWG